MEITDDMLFAAVEQAIKGEIFPEYTDEETYLCNCATMRSILERAFKAKNQNKTLKEE